MMLTRSTAPPKSVGTIRRRRRHPAARDRDAVSSTDDLDRQTRRDRQLLNRMIRIAKPISVRLS